MVLAWEKENTELLEQPVLGINWQGEAQVRSRTVQVNLSCCCIITHCPGALHLAVHAQHRQLFTQLGVFLLTR